MATRTLHRRLAMRDVSRIGVLFVGLGICFGLVLYLSGLPPFQRGTPAISRGSAAPDSAGKIETETGNDQKIYTGSIIFVPPRGDLCTQWLIDNRNGRMWENGSIDCSTAASKNTGEGQSAMRMRSIGKAFKE